MKDYIIREAEKADKKRIVKLFSEFGYYLKEIDNKDLNLSIVPASYGEYCYKKMINEIKKAEGIIYVIEVNNKVVGFVAGTVKETRRDPGDDCKPHITGRVIELFITEKYRGQILGKTLMQKILEYFKSKDCYKVNVEVFAPNKRAYKFYETLGFRERNIDLVKIL